MSYGKFAIDILKSDLGFYREVDGQWVVVYQGLGQGNGPLYLRVEDGMHPAAGNINSCTLFGTYEEACAGARQSQYIMEGMPNVLARVVQLKIKVDVQIDILEDRPIGVLDALAEIK